MLYLHRQERGPCGGSMRTHLLWRLPRQVEQAQVSLNELTCTCNIFIHYVDNRYDLFLLSPINIFRDEIVVHSAGKTYNRR
jgi:hypothetical protein